jgi:hypothetical protein
MFEQTDTDCASTAEPAPASAGPQPTMGGLARRIAARTSDLLAIAILGLGLLTVSGRLADWWSTSPDDVLAPQQSSAGVSGAQTNWGTGESPVTLLSSDLPVSMQRQIVRGDQDRADAVLIEQCRRLLAVADGTAKRSADENFQQAAERLLNELKGESPIIEERGGWRLYRLDSRRNFIPGSVFVGVSDRGESRVVCWAMAIPHGEDVWTTFLFSPPESSQAVLSRLSLPSGIKRVFSLTSPTGDELTVLRFQSESPGRTSDSLDSVAEVLTEHLTAAGWQSTRSWTQSPTGLTARFERFPANEARDAATGVAVEFALRRFESNELTGVANVIVMPYRTRS